MRWAAFLALLVFVFAGVPASAGALIEPPSLDKLVRAGHLPPIEKRVPLEPAVIDLDAEGKTSGRYGGELRLLMGKQKDTRMMSVYGYARLIALNDDLEYTPDILKSFRRSSDRPRVHAARLRKGSQMVGRASVHDRGLSFLLGRRRQQQETDAARPAEGHAGRE